MIREGHGGAICCVSSISAHVGAPGQTAYCGTKGAISMLVKALGCDLGGHGIRVNAVEPGWVKTPMSEPLLDDPGVLKYYVDRIPLHRGAEPSELAGAIAFLLSPDASYVNCGHAAGRRRLHRERGAVGRGQRAGAPAARARSGGRCRWPITRCTGSTRAAR